MNRKMRKDNTSGFKGVTASKTPGKWESQIKINGKRIFLGTFSTKLDAAKAYDRQAKELFGEFASLNLR